MGQAVLAKELQKVLEGVASVVLNRSFHNKLSQMRRREEGSLEDKRIHTCKTLFLAGTAGMGQVTVPMTQQPLPFNFLDSGVWSLVAGVLLLVTSLMLAILWFGWKAALARPPLSLFGELPLRPAVELPYESIGKIYVFLTGLHQYDNRMFNIHRAAVCRTTGRIFPNSIDWFGRIHVDWTYLQKRYRGHYVSWGSLNDQQQAEVRRAHQSMEGFQTQLSSPEPSPRAITSEYFLEKPGPLYVDLETKVLLGWKIVPGTDLEVLVVQKPRKFF